MNGAVYISFFQGQLESVLEQVVHLAVQEISKTVGSGLNTLLLETAVKEQENRRLRHQLQAWESRATSGDSPAEGTGSSAKSRSERPGGKSPEREQRQQHQQQPHGPGGEAGTPTGLPADTRRREQRRRAVEQLKTVMAQVLDFALRELTKIVEASFDDLLLEVTKMETEQKGLEERLGRTSVRGGGKAGGSGGRRRGSENDSVSPSDSEDAREEAGEAAASKEAEDVAEQPPSLLPAQDWVPILDKVFGQRWCSQIQDLEAGGATAVVGVRGAQPVEPLPAPPLSLEPSPSSPQQDPRWTPLEDMEVFSPDEEAVETLRAAAPSAASVGGAEVGSESGRRSSASMLHRLLTLPSQLLEDDAEAAAQKEAPLAIAPPGDAPLASRSPLPLPPLKIRMAVEEEEEEEDGEEEWEEKGKKKKRRRVWSECEECGRRFSRMSLLKAHRQTHNTESAAATDASSSPPPGANMLALRCSQCGKRFSSATRLHSHVRTQHLEESHLT